MVALLTLMIVVYPVLAHWFIHQGNPQYAVYLLGLICIHAAFLSIYQNHKISLGSGVALLLGFVLFYFANWQGIHVMQLMPVLINGILCVLFTTSLVAGKTALITRIASIMHGDSIPESVVVYTRSVTIVWAMFFFLLAISNLLLAMFAPLEIWSLFANLLSYVLIACLFLLEFLFRRWYLGELVDYSFGDFIKGLFRLDYARIFRDQ